MNWRALAPHKPLPAEDAALYVSRTDGGGARLAKLIQASGGNFVLVGPTGIGKSTELAQAAAAVPGAILLRVDRLLDLQQATTKDLLRTMAEEVYKRRCERLQKVSMVRIENALAGSTKDAREAKDQLLAQVRAFGPETILFIDGLEKAREEEVRGLVHVLFDQPDELRMVVVLPPALVIGPAGHSVTTQSTVFPLRVLAEPEPFLRAILLRRLGLNELPADFQPILQGAVAMSGGVPRTFLQLLLNAGTNAALGGREWPNLDDYRQAARTQAENLALLLRDGDIPYVLATRRSSIEIPLERRLRLLSHGLLLEIEKPDHVLVQPAPLLGLVGLVGLLMIERGDAELLGESHGGYCNHPLIHCHVGADPEAREYPKVRAPLALLHPWEALEWLLSTVDGRLEPEPRGEAMIDLNDADMVQRWTERLCVPEPQLRRLVQELGPGHRAIVEHLRSPA